MLSEFQRKKFSHYFGLWDMNSDGFINYDDFAMLLVRIAALKSLTPASVEYQELEKDTRQLWDTMLRFASPDANGRISLATWLEYCDAIRVLFQQVADINAPLPMARAIFSHMDTDGDGQVKASQWSAFLHAWNIQDNAAEHFRLMDADGDGKLGYIEFTRLSYLWAYSDNPDEVGNYIFGRF